MYKMLYAICFWAMHTAVNGQATATANISVSIVSGVGAEKESNLEVRHLTGDVSEFAITGLQVIILNSSSERSQVTKQQAVIHVIHSGDYNFSVLLPKQTSTGHNPPKNFAFTTYAMYDRQQQDITIDADIYMQPSGFFDKRLQSTFPVIINYD